MGAKIVAKMIAGERFTAYIVLPAWPEGHPGSAVSQAKLRWQSETIAMMYREIGQALIEADVKPWLGDQPTDWLIFLCAGKRELSGPHLDLLDPPKSKMEIKFRETLRQMITVNSKMMIVDDSYIIVGSANINERSLSGRRDTEIAVGCW